MKSTVVNVFEDFTRAIPVHLFLHETSTKPHWNLNKKCMHKADSSLSLTITSSHSSYLLQRGTHLKGVSGPVPLILFTYAAHPQGASRVASWCKL